MLISPELLSLRGVLDEFEAADVMLRCRCCWVTQRVDGGVNKEKVTRGETLSMNGFERAHKTQQRHKVKRLSHEPLSIQ